MPDRESIGAPNRTTTSFLEGSSHLQTGHLFTSFEFPHCHPEWLHLIDRNGTARPGIYHGT